MGTFKFTGSMNVRAYGVFKVEAGSVAAALETLRDPQTMLSGLFTPHGGGLSDFDFDTTSPLLWIETLEHDNGGESYIEELLLQPRELLEDAAPRMVEVLKNIRDYPANGNSEPDRMAEAIEDMQDAAAVVLHELEQAQ